MRLIHAHNHGLGLKGSLRHTSTPDDQGKVKNVYFMREDAAELINLGTK
jgi:hypothetical protein